MNNLHINSVESKKRFFWLMVVMLLGTNFLGLMPFADFVNMESKPITTIKCLIFLYFAIITYKQKNRVHKLLLFLWIAVILNKFSSWIFRGQSLLEVPFQGTFIYEFGFFYIITYIRPSLNQIEKAIRYLGTAAIIIYYAQYMLLPTPIVESLNSGWRAINDAGEFDIQRFSVTGEAVIYLYGLYALNKYILYKQRHEMIIVLATLGIALLHGYRSMMVAYALACAILYYKINGFKLNKNTIGIITIVIGFIIIVNNTSIFDSVIGQISEKNKHQSSQAFNELDRIIEWKYFFENIGKPWEWLFGAGFIGKNLTGSNNFINWVDLGFIGMTFMGGLLLVWYWIRILYTGLKIKKSSYIYITAFVAFVLFGTITLPVAFSNKNIVIQCMIFYMLSQNMWITSPKHIYRT